MQGTIDGFSYGMVTPLVGYVMACLGSALGLRCTVRSLATGRTRKPGWLALGATSIGCGIWTMHFIAMLGFQVSETAISYDGTLTFLSLLVAVFVVGAGVFTVGYRGTRPVPLLAAGVFTGLGVAGMHYLGMAAMRMDGSLTYAPGVVALSVLIAVVAATAALWAAVSVRGFLASLGASVVMGVAVTGMHYTGMASVGVQVAHDAHATSGDGSSAIDVLPLLVGPLIFLVLAAAVVMLDPMLIMGDDEPAAAGPARRIDIGDIQADLNADNNWGVTSGSPGREL
ncbi:MHYT domain-containing protein [Streptomyces hydrogenans]|uniref:Membrane protein n=1 Tax=Streptomyces hydrogenans TaxID=1873719 RepID=A0ABQ3PGL0_9ACTN|nr:MHYT domain-containing protein [Streptomyces hydrogenans]GHE25791.1 membrane protein [Streptomyces hydrogenans]GHI24156.1 membrane protein [Streptomyces hydrogenans]